MTSTMKIGGHDLGERVLVVAEIGNNHEGSFELASELVGLAAECGAQAVKFQTFRTEHYVSRDDADRFEQLKRFELSFEQFEQLAEQARSLGLLFVSTPFDLESAAFLADRADAIKVASGDLDFLPLVRAVAETAKPLILSTGLSDLDRIAAAVDAVEYVRGGDGRGNLAILHCVSAYPVEPEQANLRSIEFLRERFPYEIGYSDHVAGAEAALAAVALGARVVEKHFTLEQTDSTFRDHALSAKPSELRELVSRIETVEQMLGTAAKGRQPAEESNVAALARSVVAAHELEPGHVVEPADVTWVRPGGGLAPGEEALLLGKPLRRRLEAGERLSADDVET